MDTGINGSELLVLILVVLIVAGPEKLPEFARQLARLTREVKRIASGARERVREEFGPEFDDLDFTVFDPRQYDPRRIVRDALLEDEPPAPRARPRADRRGTTAPRRGSTAVAADRAVADVQARNATVNPVNPVNPVSTAPTRVPGQEATPPASTATSAPQEAILSPHTAGPAAPLSPREIVARTRGLRPAGESPAVVAALAPLGVTAQAAAESAAQTADAHSVGAHGAHGAQAAAQSAAVPAATAAATAPGGHAAVSHVLPGWATPTDPEAAAAVLPRAATGSAADATSDESGLSADGYAVPFDDEAT